MSIISFNGIDYGCSGSPKIEQITEANYQALVQAGEVDSSIAYFRMDAPSLYPLIQDDGTATDLENGKLVTGQTIESYVNSRIQDNASATDLENGKLATGQTIKNWAKNTNGVDSASITLMTGQTAIVRLWANGLKSFDMFSNNFQTTTYTSTSGIIPSKFLPVNRTEKYVRGVGFTSGYHTRGITIGDSTDPRVYIYPASSVGMYCSIYYI